MPEILEMASIRLAKNQKKGHQRGSLLCTCAYFPLILLYNASARHIRYDRRIAMIKQ